MSLSSQQLLQLWTGRLAAGSVLGLLCSSGCGGAAEPEDSEPVNPATLDCNAPLSESAVAQLTGATEAAPPAPEDAALESMGTAEQGNQAGASLLAIDPQQRLYKVNVPEHCVPLGQVFSSYLKICVDAAGNVSGMTVLMPSLAIIDSQLPYVIARWKYQPYLVDGRPTPFCYEMKYTMR